MHGIWKVDMYREDLPPHGTTTTRWGSGLIPKNISKKQKLYAAGL
jgi:hypothetical protein